MSPTDPTRTADPAETERVQAQTRAQWGSDPAGSVAAGDEPLGTPESFRRVEEYRYQEQPWMHDTFLFERFAGQRGLEVGVGLGTDHLQFARAGARMTGIDLTPRCIELTSRRCADEGIDSALQVMDAENMTFEDDSFDFVYSFGVLHHTTSTERAFAEVRRVLRPGGVFLGGLYSHESWFWAQVRLIRLLRREFRQETLEERKGRIEMGGGDAVPVVRLFGREELRGVLRDAGFERIAIRRRHAGLGRLTEDFPAEVERTLGRIGGWYLIHEAG